ncbi:MAG: response regulator [Planctomycetota bacterium]
MEKQTILVADDEPAVRRLLRVYLERAGYCVTEAANGRSAIRQTLEEEPALLLLDLAMPDQDGLQALRELRSHHSRVPVIAISGAGSREVMLRSAELLGAARIFPKPFDAEDLLQAIEATLEKTIPEG